MPAATTKSELLAVTDAEWARLAAVLERMPEPLAIAAQGGEARGVDIVTHRAHWIGLFFQWLEEGEAAQMPDHGVKWNALKSYNAALRARYRDLSWEEANVWLAQSHARLRDWIAGAEEPALYGGPMPGGTGWSTGRYAEAAGPSHYRSAAKYLRKLNREAERSGSGA